MHRPPADDASSRAVIRLQQWARAAANKQPENLAALVKDAGVVAKLLRNPADQPNEEKFQKVKLGNAAVARVLAAVDGARELLIACGFVADAASEFLVLKDVSATLLRRTADAAVAVQQMLQELQWIYSARSQVPSMANQPWAADTAAVALVQACLGALNAPGDPKQKVVLVQRLHLMLFTAELQECSAAARRSTVAVPAVRRVALELLHDGAHDVPSLVLAHQCLAALWPPGDPQTLPARLEFISACLEAKLPPDDDPYPMELRLRLTHGKLLGSTVDGLSAFSEVGVRCGVLRQELLIEYDGETGQDAGGLRRQFFDLFSSELVASGLWTTTAAGGLRPLDDVLATQLDRDAADAARRRRHMETCGRVCGMALYQELHRRRNPMPALLQGGEAPPSLLGAPFALYFIRAIQHDPPSSLPELQAELSTESLEGSPDYRAGKEILVRSVAESGLEGETFVRALRGGGGTACGGGVEAVPLVEGGAQIALTDENKREWLERLLRSELVEGFAEAASQFRSGLLDVVAMAHVDAAHVEHSRWLTPHFFLLSAGELQQQWSGAPVSREFIEELSGVAEVHADVQAQAAWLWDILVELDDEWRAKVFRFVTGGSRRPLGGIGHFRIGPKEGGDGAFPFAHACANALDMPSYSSRGILREQLIAAVEAAHDKFTDL